LTGFQVLRIISDVNQIITKDNASQITIPSPNKLTKRQKEVVTLIATGHNMKEIAYALDISIKTVEYHRAGALAALSIRDIPVLIHWAIVTRLVEPMFKAEFIKKQIEEIVVTQSQRKYHFKRPTVAALRDAKYMEPRASYGTRRMVPDLGI
jgi:DNA-binding CsgD family transcriptional regulator